MRRFFIIAALAVALPASGLAADLVSQPDTAVHQLKKQMAYSKARNRLLAGGWTAAPEDPGKDAAARCGGRTEICDAYPETDSCSGTGLGYCLFRFSDYNGRILTVTTVGEDLPDLRVHNWTKP